MNNLSSLPKVHLHPILLVFIFISMITGTFIDLFIILMIVGIHELGHYFMAKHYGWRVRGIMLWIFGGVMDTDEHGNRSMKEEALVTIAGPFQHVIIHMLLFFLGFIPYISEGIITTAIHYNAIILLFNLLPVYPLDGGKLLLLLLSKYLPYKKAYQITIVSSIVLSISFILFQLLFYSFTLSAILIMIFLLMENWKEWKHRYYVFLRFLLNRYEGLSHVSDIQPINVSSDSRMMDVFSQFRRGSKHSIYINFANKERIMVDEADCLYSYFHDKHHSKLIGDVFVR